MRILHVSQDPGVPVFGRKGGSTHIREVCRAFLALGHEVRLAAAALGPDPDPALEARLTIVPPVAGKIIGANLRRVLTDRRFARALPPLAREFAPDLVYERHSLYSGAALRLARRLGVPHMLEVNAILSDEQAARLHLPRWAQRRERAVIAGADQLVVVSAPIRERCLAWGADPERILLMPISVDPAHFAPRPRDPALRAQWGWGREDVVIGYLGALTSWHAPGLLLEAAARLAPAQPRLRVLFLGGAEQHIAQLRAQAQRLGLAERVRFLGSVAYEAVPPLLAEFDVGVLPGVHEWATPTKLFEYGAMGIPAVAPRTPNIQAVIADGETGLLFPPGDVEALGTALTRLLGQPALRTTLAERGRERVLAEHTWARHAEALLARGQALAAARRNRP